MKLWYSIVEHDFNSEGLLRILDEAVSKNADEVVLMAETEWQTPGLYDAIVKRFKEKNVKITILFGSIDSPYYDEYCNETGLDKENLHFWPTYWLKWGFENLCGPGIYQNNTVDPDKFIHPFISLNNRSHFHRCAFIEEMAKQDMIDKGVVTWVKHLNENPNYPYQYFDNRQMLLEDDFKTQLDSFLLPKEFNESLFHVVTEATHRALFITEKTAIPLLMKKPFFVLAAPRFHEYLDELGFMRYDEIIDYSYDNIEDLHLRTEKFVENINRFKDLNYKEVYELLLPKIEFNHKRALELFKDPTLIPDLIKERYECVCNTGNQLHVDNRYVKFVNDTLDPMTMSIWDTDITHRIQNLHNSYYGISRIILNAAIEFNYDTIAGSRGTMLELMLRTDRLNIKLDVITGTHSNYNLIKPSPKYPVPTEHMTVHYWPTFWLTMLLMRLSVSPNYQMNQSIGLHVENMRTGENTPLRYPFISMNKAPKIHRAMMMDMLAKYELIDKGLVIWREPVQGYTYKHWTEEILMRDQKEGFRYQEQLPVEYALSFMQIVPESDEDVFTLSEKTGMALFFNKPFLVLGCQGFHKILQELGFKLYDELFDYSFDDEPDTMKRCEMIAQNAQRYIDKTPGELKEIYNSVFEKCVYNKQVAIKLATDSKLLPSCWQDLLDSQVKNNIADFPVAINNFIKNNEHEFRI